MQESVSVRIGELQRTTQQHCENEEESHLGALEKLECIESELLDKLLLMTFCQRRTLWKGKSVKPKYEGSGSSHVKLQRRGFESQQAHHPQRHDETYGAPDPHWRIIPDNIHPAVLHRAVGHRYRQGQCRHVEHHGEEQHPEEGVRIVNCRYQ